MGSLFQYDFIIRALEAGLLIGAIAPLIGIFLVLRRYSLIADTLSHVSLAGVAIGLLFKINPLITAIGAATVSSVVIDKLRTSKKIYGETALSIFLSGSLALAIILIGLANGFNVDIFSYLFGSIVTVKNTDLYIISVLSIIIILLLATFFKELIYISFDEESAQVSGIKVKTLNTFFIVLAAAMIAISIPIIGILLISALLVVPTVTALQYKKSFKATLLIAEIISLFSVMMGLVISFYLNLSPGGTIVLLMLTIFSLTLFYKNFSIKN